MYISYSFLYLYSGSRTRSPLVGSPPPEAAHSSAEPVISSPSSSSSRKSSPSAKTKPAANLNQSSQSSLSPVITAKRKQAQKAAASKQQLKDKKLLARTFKTSGNKLVSGKGDAKDDGGALVNGSGSVGSDEDLVDDNKKLSSTKTKKLSLEGAVNKKLSLQPTANKKSSLPSPATKKSSLPSPATKRSSLPSTIHKKSSSPAVTTKKSSFSSNCDTKETSLDKEVGESEQLPSVSKQDHELCNGQLTQTNSSLSAATAEPGRDDHDCGHGLPQPIEKENQPTPGE